MKKLRSIIKRYFFFVIPLIVLAEFANAYIRYILYSGIFIFPRKRNKMLGKIIEGYHSIERSLALPNTRLGFARGHMMELIEMSMIYIAKFGVIDSQIRHCVSVINEYKQYHSDNNYVLDDELSIKIDQLQDVSKITAPSKQDEFLSDEYFRYSDSSFFDFSNSRKSVRNYSEEDVPIEILRKAVALAQNAPSACNRQGGRIYIVQDKELIRRILSVHVGTGGFGYLTNKLIVVAEDLQVSNSVYEMNQIYTDGGILTMNILYSLHHYKIAACPLNCSFSIGKTKKLRKIIGMGKSECFIALISCGMVSAEFETPLSKRFELKEILTIR